MAPPLSSLHSRVPHLCYPEHSGAHQRGEKPTQRGTRNSASPEGGASLGSLQQAVLFMPQIGSRDHATDRMGLRSRCTCALNVLMLWATGRQRVTPEPLPQLSHSP